MQNQISFWETIKNLTDCNKETEKNENKGKKYSYWYVPSKKGTWCTSGHVVDMECLLSILCQHFYYGSYCYYNLWYKQKGSFIAKQCEKVPGKWFIILSICKKITSFKVPENELYRRVNHYTHLFLSFASITCAFSSLNCRSRCSLVP